MAVMPAPAFLCRFFESRTSLLREAGVYNFPVHRSLMRRLVDFSIESLVLKGPPKAIFELDFNGGTMRVVFEPIS